MMVISLDNFASRACVSGKTGDTWVVAPVVFGVVTSAGVMGVSKERLVVLAVVAVGGTL